MIKAVIFDMDGLLIDSEPFWRKAHVEALAEHGVTIDEDDVRKMAGQRTDEVVRHWRETHNLIHIPNETLEASVVKRVMENITLEGKELPGVRELISVLKDHTIPMAVASSSAPEVIETVLMKLGLKGDMEFAYSAKHEPFGKPHPGVFLTTAKKLNVDVMNCVVFEDSLSGIRAAKSANMKCIAIPEEVNMRKPEFTHEADIVMPTLERVDWLTLTTLFEEG